MLHQGVVPNVNLAMAAGVAHRWDPLQLCWSPELDDEGNTSVPGIAIAGDGAGIGGACVAEERGRLAAIATVRSLDPSRHRAQRATDPPGPVPPPDADALSSTHSTSRRARSACRRATLIVCRCEEVTARQIRDTVRLGCEGPNQMKAFLRCGMGPCQGRLCGLTVTELIAERAADLASSRRLLSAAPTSEAHPAR